MFDTYVEEGDTSSDDESEDEVEMLKNMQDIKKTIQFDYKSTTKL